MPNLTASTEDEMAMQKLRSKISRFLASEEGPTAVEYSVMLALIILVCLAAINSFGTATSASFANSATSLSTVSGS